MKNQYGKIKFYNREKAYGFIIPDDGGKDMFFHKKGLGHPAATTHRSAARTIHSYVDPVNLWPR